MRKRTWLSGILLLLLGACTQVDVTMPKGEQGDPGLSAYEYWKSKVADGTIKWPAEAVELADYLKYIKGDKGRDGANGESAYDLWYRLVANPGIDNPHKAGEKWPASENTQADFYRFLTGATGERGQVPHVGEDGYWYIGTTKTNEKARGAEATPPVVEVIDGTWHVNGRDLGVAAIGKDGKDGKPAVFPTVSVGANGNWLVDDQDLGKPAKGADGQLPEVYIDPETKVWVINGRPTKEPAFAKDGQDGANGADAPNGKSAYDLWVDEVAKGEMPDPTKNDGSKWPRDKSSKDDFWRFIMVSPLDTNTPPEPGTPGKPVTIVMGRANVIAQYYIQDKGEYVDVRTGGVRYKVYDDHGNIAPGAIVKGMPSIDPTKVYTANEKGEFEVPAEDLPSIQELAPRLGAVASVEYKGRQLVSAANTYVPNRIRARMTIVNEVQYNSGISTFDVTFQRKINPNSPWTYFPLYLLTTDGYMDSNFQQYNEIFSSRVHRVGGATNGDLDPDVFKNEDIYYTSNHSAFYLGKDYLHDDPDETGLHIMQFHMPNFHLLNKYEVLQDGKETTYWGRQWDPNLFFKLNGLGHSTVMYDIDWVYGAYIHKRPDHPDDFEDWWGEDLNLYGETDLQSNASFQVFPTQAPPFVKSIKLKGKREQRGIVSFDSAEVTLDNSLINYKLYSSSHEKEVTDNGELVLKAKYEAEELALQTIMYYVEFGHPELKVLSRNPKKLSTETTIVVRDVYLGSHLKIKDDGGGFFDDISVGTLVETAPGVYDIALEQYDETYFKRLLKYPKKVRLHAGYPKITVTYEE